MAGSITNGLNRIIAFFCLLWEAAAGISQTLKQSKAISGLPENADILGFRCRFEPIEALDVVLLGSHGEAQADSRGRLSCHGHDAFAFATAWWQLPAIRAIAWIGRGARGPVRDALLSELEYSV
jgi:hypothetical protein